MRAVFSHSTAIELLDADAASNGFSGQGLRGGIAMLPESFSVVASPFEISEFREMYSLTTPLHAIVSDRGHVRDRGRLVKTHFWGNPSVGDRFMRLSPGVMLSSPEVAFMQLASELSIVELVKLGFDLCGTYSIGKRYAGYQREPLTCADEIGKAVARSSRRHGVKAARKAVPYIRDDSASPMETAAAMLIGLPYKYGGASFGMPFMNHAIKLNEDARRMLDQRVCKCDLFYPDLMLDLEYESYEFHSGRREMERDSLRREALALMGVRVLTVTYQQLVDPEKFEALISLVSKMTGKRFRPQVEGYWAKQAELRKIVLGRS